LNIWRIEFKEEDFYDIANGVHAWI
jgi:hypothetical protein